MGNEIISVIIPSGRPERVAVTVHSLLTQNLLRDMLPLFSAKNTKVTVFFEDK